ncbi:hypothetical protein BJ944DRAFT_273223 [Cunninghamella echinulata]|nr:hypothetical protein BJ944DRAFT_273223 [Cunninghamella echinulata]
MDWNELFGSDDEEYNDDDAQKKIFTATAINSNDIETFDDIPGLILWHNALTHEQQINLLYSLLDNFGTETNQYLQFGKLDPFLQKVADKIQHYSFFPSHIRQRQPLFNQASINYYEQGEGIISHVDLLQYEDGIAILSLLSSVCMTMKPATKESMEQGYATIDGVSKEESSHQQRDILLRPGDILLLHSAARYEFEHGIIERMFDVINDETIVRGKRVSVSLRYKKVDGP